MDEVPLTHCAQFGSPIWKMQMKTHWKAIMHCAPEDDELATPELRDAVRAELQEAFDAVLTRGGAVTATTDDSGHRTVTIEGVNAEPCGGTHVSDLSQLKDVRVLELKVKRGALKVRYEAEHA